MRVVASQNVAVGKVSIVLLVLSAIYLCQCFGRFPDENNANIEGRTRIWEVLKSSVTRGVCLHKGSLQCKICSLLHKT